MNNLKSYLKKVDYKFFIELCIYSVFLILLVYFNRQRILYNMSFVLDEQGYVAFNEAISGSKMGYLTTLANMFLRCFGGAMCLCIGAIFSPSYSKLKYFTSCKLILHVQWVLILVLLFSYASFWITGSITHLPADLSLGNSHLMNLIFGSDSSYRLPITFFLQSISLFQFVYLMLLSYYVSKETANKYSSSLWFVLKTYGVGFLLFNILVAFILFAFII